MFRAELGTEAAQAEVRALLIDNSPDTTRSQPARRQRRAGPARSRALRAGRLIRCGWTRMPTRRAGAGRGFAAFRRAEAGREISRPLDEIYDNPGFGPNTCNAGLMARIFDGLKVEQPVQRMNWTLYPTPTLHHPYQGDRRQPRPAHLDARLSSGLSVRPCASCPRAAISCSPSASTSTDCGAFAPP